MGDLSTLGDAMAADRPAREEVRIVEGSAASAWLVVITRGQHERNVCHQLRNQAFETYLPLRLLDDAQARKRGIASAPLFPRILFARATLDAYRWQAIFSTIGVQRVLCDPKRPKGVKPEFVERLREREIDGFFKLGLRDPSKPAPPARPKEPRHWVKLADVVDGLLDEPLDSNRASVLLSLLMESRAALARDLQRI